MEATTPSKVFVEIEPTQPLDDKRRLRVKSVGRPPSQLFMKENILQRSESMDNLSATSEGEDEANVSPVKITSMSHLMQEVQKRTSSNSADYGKQPTVSLQKPPVLKRVPLPLPAKKSKQIVAPWMQEVQKKREHKRSLRGDETVQIEENQFRYVLGVDHNYKEAITREKHSNQTASTTQMKVDVDSNNASLSTTKIVKSRTISENNIKSTATANIVEKTTKQVLNKTEPQIEACNTIPHNQNTTKENVDEQHLEVNKTTVPIQKERLPVDNKSERQVDVKEVEHFQIDCKQAVPPQSETVASKTEKQRETEVVTTPANVTSRSVEIREDKEVQLKKELLLEQPKQNAPTCIEIRDDKAINKDDETINSPTKKTGTVQTDSQKNAKDKALQLMLDEVEDFNKKHRTWLKEIRKHMEKVQTDVDQQRKEVKMFVESIKAKISVLAPDACNS